MPLELHSILTALATLDASPMSRKRAMLLVLLIDAAVDAQMPAGGDVLEHRATVAAGSPDLALVMELAAMRDGGARLAIETSEASGELSEGEYMVSRYNGGRMPLLVIRESARSVAALPVLRRAVAALRGT